MGASLPAAPTFRRSGVVDITGQPCIVVDRKTERIRIYAEFFPCVEGEVVALVVPVALTVAANPGHMTLLSQRRYVLTGTPHKQGHNTAYYSCDYTLSIIGACPLFGSRPATSTASARRLIRQPTVGFRPVERVWTLVREPGANSLFLTLVTRKSDWPREAPLRNYADTHSVPTADRQPLCAFRAHGPDMRDGRVGGQLLISRRFHGDQPHLAVRIAVNPPTVALCERG